MPRLVAFLAFLFLAGCTWTVNDARFRTVQAETAYERAVKAVAQHCDGVRFENPTDQIVTSHWRVLHSRDGAHLVRCQVSIVQASGELGADVRVGVTMKRCPLVELNDLDALGDSETCAVTFLVPQEVANGLQDAVKKVEYDVRR